MNISINCTYNDRGAWCRNNNIPRSLFGIGARCCKEFSGCVQCELKETNKRPKSPPPAPKAPEPRIIPNGRPKES